MKNLMRKNIQIYLKKDGKMSSSDKITDTIFLSDNEETIKNKINKARTGAANTLQEFRVQKLNTESDFCYVISKVFQLNTATDKYKVADISSSEFKKETAIALIEKLKNLKTVTNIIPTDLQKIQEKI